MQQEHERWRQCVTQGHCDPKANWKRELHGGPKNSTYLGSGSRGPLVTAVMGREVGAEMANRAPCG